MDLRAKKGVSEERRCISMGLGHEEEDACNNAGVTTNAFVVC